MFYNDVKWYNKSIFLTVNSGYLQGCGRISVQSLSDMTERDHLSPVTAVISHVHVTTALVVEEAYSHNITAK